MEVSRVSTSVKSIGRTKYLHPLEQRMIPAAKAGAPNPTGSLWLHLETSHWSCSPGIPGKISRRKTLKTPRPPWALSCLFSLLGEIRMAGDMSPKHCTTHELSNPNQELYSSEYTGKNSNYIIRKEHSLPFTAVTDGMLYNKQVLYWTDLIQLWGKDDLLHIHLLCYSWVLEEQHKQSALNIFFSE